MNVEIITATIKDIPAIQNIAYTTWPIAYSNIITKEQINYMLQLMYSNQALEQQFQHNHTFFIAKENNQALGFVSISAQENTIFKLHKLYVLPQLQTKGVGKSLLQAALSFAKANNATHVQLQVNRNNPAKQFYLNQGFSILQEANFDIGNGFFMNDYIMQITL
jgi:ribosomal protein S18 acetylase RimI-like enzyme